MTYSLKHQPSPHRYDLTESSSPNIVGRCHGYIWVEMGESYGEQDNSMQVTVPCLAPFSAAMTQDISVNLADRVSRVPTWPLTVEH